MNIGIFTDAYYPQVSGVVTSTIILKNELIRLGHNVTIITVAHPDVEEQEGIIRLPSIPFFLLPSQRVGMIYSRKIMNKIKKIDLDIIHTQTEFSIGIFGRIVAKRLDIPVVHTYHTMYEDYIHYISHGIMLKPASQLAKKVSELYCRDCSAIIVPTIKVKDALENYGLTRHIDVIPTGVNIEPFKRSNYNKETIKDEKRSFGINETQPVVLFIGRIAKEKSIDIIINSMKELTKRIPNCKLLIVGDGPERENLEDLAKALGIEKSVVFAGEKPWEEIGRYYQMGDVFVGASLTETQGLTFEEAMAAQIPVVAKYDKNLDGIIRDKINGRFFYKDENLAEILFQILMDKEESALMVKNAYDRMEPLSSKCFGENVEKVYMEVEKQNCMLQNQKVT
ncbi:glycosyltransferase family 4 protein [Clostridium sp. CM028]|uniref:glycosyltransferase family 4 protein n=1 Tax=unclassified Clostridium TaxID=2614128 RepID=UPI001C0DCBD1|nr:MULTISPECIES: glycosyltransferase family 4 protein [unclassified Clostridium]MBU3093434.1 glycosyltransferase family 4 protein [Clostridium sp. CF011]MBW9146186.1 glycosyltransferase family 4 protein [Clostridium sp. CM027]MBW9149658.1 glycosyltransferase family 4 protein [Clostridium sp. CM028]UVE39833.1 glycosyltransferase family 4 protein [Clostridium sp. CM027]WAG68742.1 glycosyltransferase family 4 protein [Clostridium sp. CF011]